MDDIKDAIVHDTLIPRWTSIPASVTSTYSDITAKDNSRIHNGHVFHFHQTCTVQHDRDNSAESSLQATLKRKRSFADFEANPRTREAQESLDTVLRKLGKLSLSVRHRKEGDGAEKIARRVATLFEALTTSEDASSWDKTTARHLEKLGATVKWAERFDINSAPRKKPMSTCVKVRRRQILVQIDNFIISLTTESLDSWREGGIQEMKTFSTLRVEPQHPSSRPALAVFFSEHWDGDTTSTIPPTIVAYKMVKGDSDVFGLVRADDLDGLLRLLACGEASIYDCDESGRSLLYYACYADSFRCCSFLVGCGADVDRVEASFQLFHEWKYVCQALPPADPHCPEIRNCFYKSSRFVTDDNVCRAYPKTLLQVSCEDIHMLTHRRRNPVCFEILSRAGADPTVTGDPRWHLSPLLKALNAHTRPHSPLHTYLKESSPYIDFQERINNGRGYWLRLCSGAALLDNLTLLQTFRDKGAEVAEVDQFGFNCLFVFMYRVCEPENAKEYKALLCLLDIFNNIHALDAAGNDVFAYINELRDWPMGKNDELPGAYGSGSYSQDLWYCALRRSKLEIRHNVQPCSRLARYTRRYTPKRYLALCYLDNWEKTPARFERQIQTLLQEHPLSVDEERIQREIESSEEWKLWESGLGEQVRL